MGFVRRFVLLALTIAIAATTALAAPTSKALPAPFVTVEGISEYRFPNGFRVLLLPDDSRPIVTVNMTYFVGSRHEGYGESGMAHLLEHMLFRGTKKYPDMDKLYEMRGGFSNGTTSWDRTNYFISLPAKDDNLDFAVDVAFEQMTSSLMRNADLQKEFSVVRNEFEAGENNADQVLLERMYSAAYLWHNYGKSPIGSRSDIERVPIDNLRAFYQRFYRPDNAMLILAGKFDPQRALRLIAAHCNRLPRPKRPLPATYTVEPVQDGERTVTLERTGEIGVVAVAYHVVAAADARSSAAFAIADVLTEKPWGRAYQNLVATNLATEVFNQSTPLAEPGLLIIGAKVRKDQSLDKAREALLATIADLQKQPITQEELDRVEARTRKQIELQLTDPETVGLALTEYASMGDWRLIFLARDEKVTPTEIASAVQDFVKPSNRTVGIFRPTSKPERSPLPGPLDINAEIAKLKVGPAARSGETFESSIANIEKRTERTQLPSGLKLALLPKRARGGVVEGQMTFHYGSEAQLRGRLEAARLLGPMLMRGSKHHSYQQLRDAFDKLHAEVAVAGDLAEGEGEGGGASEAAPGGITIQWKTTRDNLVPLLTLLAEVLQQPTFAPTEFSTLQRAMLANAEELRHEPMAMAGIELQRRINPLPAESIYYRQSGDELIAELKTTKVETVKQVYQELVGGSVGELVLVGDFDSAAVKAELLRSFGTWRSPVPFVRTPHALAVATPTKLVLPSPDKQMAMAMAGLALPMRDDDPDVAALELASYVLGSGFNSRLLDRLRTKEGISYSAGAQLETSALDPVTQFAVLAMAANPKVKRAAEILREEVTRWSKGSLTATELAEGKQSFAEVFNNDLARDETVVQLLAESLYYGRTLDYQAKLQAKVASLTLAEVNEVLRRRIDPQKLVEVIAGDVK